MTGSFDNVRRFAIDLADECDGLSLIEADRALDDARRALWLRHFSDAPVGELVAPSDRPGASVARQIALRLDGVVTVLEADPVLLEARIVLWSRRFDRETAAALADQLRADAADPAPGTRLQ